MLKKTEAEIVAAFPHLSCFLTRPAPFSTSTIETLWTDPHIAREMLRLHLDGDSDLASRRPASIDAFVGWLDARLPLDGRALTDLGCGPGLYAERYARRGARVTGLDISASSILHARRVAEAAHLSIDYRVADYLKADLPARQDLVTLIYGDFCALAPANRRLLLDRVRQSLTPGGRFVFDVFPTGMLDGLREEAVLERRLTDGFWAEGDYVGFRVRFLYSDIAVSVERYLIVTPGRTFAIDNWLQYYTPDSVTAELSAAGFTEVRIADFATGGPWDGTASAFAVIARP
jgi:SAM-dependent methyltransferase